MKTAVEAIEREMRIDRRRKAAQAIGHAIFDEIHHLIPHDVEREVHTRLCEVLYRNGVLLVTDEERWQLGLEPADAKGWTPSERKKYENEKLKAMHERTSFVVKLDESK